MRQALNIDRTAVFLIRRYGEQCTKVALQRSCYCALRGDEASAAEWRLVLRRIGEFQAAAHDGPLH